MATYIVELTIVIHALLIITVHLWFGVPISESSVRWLRSVTGASTREESYNSDMYLLHSPFYRLLDWFSNNLWKYGPNWDRGKDNEEAAESFNFHSNSGVFESSERELRALRAKRDVEERIRHRGAQVWFSRPLGADAAVHFVLVIEGWKYEMRMDHETGVVFFNASEARNIPISQRKIFLEIPSVAGKYQVHLIGWTDMKRHEITAIGDELLDGWKYQMRSFTEFFFPSRKKKGNCQKLGRMLAERIIPSDKRALDWKTFYTGSFNKDGQVLLGEVLDRLEWRADPRNAQLTGLAGDLEEPESVEALDVETPLLYDPNNTVFLWQPRVSKSWLGGYQTRFVVFSWRFEIGLTVHSGQGTSVEFRRVLRFGRT